MKNILNKDFKFYFFSFFFFSILLFIEGFFHYYSNLIGYFWGYLSFFNYGGHATGYNIFIWNENGLVEIVQILLLLFSIIYFIHILKVSKNLFSNILIRILIFLYFIGLIYFFFEEISWGQSFFKWESSSFFKEFNNQNETNIHNISNLLDQLPRALLSIWCSFSFLFVNCIGKNQKYYLLKILILPSKNLKYISIYFLIFFLPELILDKLNIYPEHTVDLQKIQITEIADFVTFNFIKLSEYQELILCLYIFTHSYYLKKFLFTKKN